MPSAVESDAALATRLATAAGRLLLEVRAELADADAADRKRAGDARAQELLARELAAARPGDAVLSEEAVDDPVRLSAPRVWIVDPLDGTREFSELGRTDWAVHVALWEAGPGLSPGAGRLTAGAVALPALDLTLATVPPPAPRPPYDGPVRLVVSRTRAPALVTAVAERLGAELVPMGSAGAKTMAVVRGEADAYVHGGGQYEWDSAAPVAVAAAAGLHTSRLDGSPLLYNRPDPLLPDLVVARADLAEDLLAAIRSTTVAAAGTTLQNSNG